MLPGLLHITRSTVSNAIITSGSPCALTRKCSRLPQIYTMRSQVIRYAWQNASRSMNDDSDLPCRVPRPLLFPFAFTCACRHICSGAGTAYLHPKLRLQVLWTAAGTLVCCLCSLYLHAPSLALAPEASQHSIDHLLHRQPAITTTKFCIRHTSKRLYQQGRAKPGSPLKAKC